MDIRLPGEEAALVRKLVEAGHFLTPEEAVLAGLSLLKDQYELYKVKREELRKLIAVGIEQADRGELIDAAVVFRKLEEKIERRSEQPT